MRSALSLPVLLLSSAALSASPLPSAAPLASLASAHSRRSSRYSAVFEKVVTSRTRELHFQSVPPKVHQAVRRKAHGCSQFWKRARSEVPAFGTLAARSAAGGQRRLGPGITSGSRAAQGNPPQARLAHATCGSQGRLGIRPGNPYRWWGLDTFWALFLLAHRGRRATTETPAPVTGISFTAVQPVRCWL